MLNRDISINDIITKYPSVKEFLLINDVDCMKCSVKTCLLKDILEYHNFSKEDQILMYAHMDRLAHNLTDEMPKFVAQKTSNKFSPLVDALITEHKLIKELIYTLQYISSKKDFLLNYGNDIAIIMDYISLYADKFHHQKEEDLLFSLFKDKEIVAAMFEEHEIGRAMRKNILESQNDTIAKACIEEFSNMLSNHIYKEDNVLFPYLDKLLSTEEINDMSKKLYDYDLTLEKEVSDYIESFNAKEFEM